MSGNQVFVTARLIDAATGVQRWAERYIRSMADILGVQEDIASAACRELGVHLTSGTRPPLSIKPGSRGSGVYTLYLKGRYC
ncbi:MAG: adenylate/guanylate cyclase domain-containing protein, partial [Vicinamibacterales bacterium]